MTQFFNYELAQTRSAAHHDPDWLLQQFVSLANDGTGTFGVTLLVDGTLVSGNIIGGAEYLESMGKQFGGAIGMAEEEAAALYKPFIDAYYSKGDAADAKVEDDEDEDHVPPSFIHLKNVKILQASGLVPQKQDGLLWRGRLAHVGGWMLGTLGDKEL